MLTDALIALAITAVAIILGVTVHPVLFFLVVFAIAYFVFRRPRTRGRVRTGSY